MLLAYSKMLILFLAVRSRNRELLDAEGDGSTEDSRPSKRRKSAASAAELSEDEIAMAATLPSLNAREEEGFMSDGDNSRRQSRGEDEDLAPELEGVNVENVDVDMDNRPEEDDISNEVCPTLP